MKDQELLIDFQEHPLLLQHRRRAWEKFLGLAQSPHLPTDSFKRAEYTHLPTKEEVRTFIPEQSKSSFIVLVNGWFCPQLSDSSGMKKCILLPLKEAANTFGSLVQGTLSKTYTESHNHLALLNQAMHQEGAFLYLPPKSVHREPLFILSIIAAERCQWIMPKLQFFIGASSDIKVQQSTKYLSGQHCLYNCHIDCTVDEQASVTFIADDFDTKGYTGWYFDNICAYIKSKAHISTLKLATNLPAFYDTKITLAGEEAKAQVSGLSLLEKSTLVSTNVLVHHLAPCCHSMQLYKNILTESSQANFQGKILVGSQAQKTESYQLNRSLLLSDLATSKSSPNLEIFADDVKASHGSTCGQLDEEALFYLTSRGIDTKAAKKILLTGFSEEITKMSFSEEQQRHFSHLLETYEVV